MVERAQTRNMTVKFMIEKLNEAGCAVGPAFFKVQECDKLVGGGFAPGAGVTLLIPMVACGPASHCATHW